MPNTFTAKVLFEGQLSNVVTTLYTVPANTKAYVKFQSYKNVGVAVEHVQRFILRGAGPARELSPATLDLNESAVDKYSETLEAGDQIQAATTNLASVDCVITGVEET